MSRLSIYLIERTMFLVINRPTAVRRKLLSEKWLLSKGKYQGRGESAARSFSQMTFSHKVIRIGKYQTENRHFEIISQTVICRFLRKNWKRTSKPACLSASRHFPVNLMSGRPSPISISACTDETCVKKIFITQHAKSKETEM